MGYEERTGFPQHLPLDATAYDPVPNDIDGSFECSCRGFMGRRSPVEPSPIAQQVPRFAAGLGAVATF